MMAGSSQAEYVKEVRFAVVMYGGVSLAIYINGIAQELLRLVRSTSASHDDGSGGKNPVPAEELKGTERVYRRLSCLLSDPQLLKNFRAALEDNSASSNTVSPNGASNATQPKPDLVDQRLTENIVNTRFVIDVLSGTSAGGINAIFLAKALANDQNLDELKSLWVTEGDIALLINDKQSVAGLELSNQQPPQSLLNSRRMYLKLLKAFQGMETTKKSAPKFVSPHVDELDLFITTTDIEGLIYPLRLSDTVVYERRHRNVFHFKYATTEATGSERNDFLSKNDPFLAFAARCTSSFPFAFEPMRLCDIDEVLDCFTDFDNKDSRKTALDDWKTFFKENKDQLTGKEIEFHQRSYGDGGYLDNKPFSYATEILLRRSAPVVVDRKLIYIEPSPEHPEDEPPRKQKYQALENVKAALLDLPTYETIREDLQRVMERNELIKRVNRITTAIERDLDNQTKWTRPVLEKGEWATLDLAGLVTKFGVYYLPYRRLRISSTTDELAKLVSRLLNLNQESAQFTAVRHLIHAWREQCYPDYHPADETKEEHEATLTASQFLIDFDFQYWSRRLNFIRGKIDQLYGLVRLPARAENGDGVDQSQLARDDAAILERLRRLRYHPLEYADLSAERKKQIQNVVSYLKCELNEMYKKLRVSGRNIQSKANQNSSDAQKRFADAIAGIQLSAAQIDFLLGLPPRTEAATTDGQPLTATRQDFSRHDDNELTKRATQLLFEPAPPVGGEAPAATPKLQPTDLGKKFIEAGAALSALFHETVADETWARGRALLSTKETMPEPCPSCKKLKIDSQDLNSVREYLWRYFSQFDDFDQISFPILFASEVGESDVVEVLRISPEDATSLIDERAERQKANGRQKLAGTALHHFGAFLDQVWRQNDILWGRLDGAERLITALLPDPEDKKVRAKLIGEAHEAILIEELTQESRTAVSALITEALVKMSSGMAVNAAVDQVLRPLQDDTLRKRLSTVVRAGLANEKLLEFMKSSYVVNRDLDPKLMLRSISRSTQVIGNMFEDMATQQGFEGKRLAWIARMGQLFWGLVEVAVPNSLLHLFFRHWLKVIYVFEALLLVASILLGADPAVKKFAWTLLALTLTLTVVVFIVGDYIRGRKKWLRTLAVFVVAAVLFFAVLGFSEVFGWGLKDQIFAPFVAVLAWLRAFRS
jgi:patatin-related protein